MQISDLGRLIPNAARPVVTPPTLDLPSAPADAYTAGTAAAPTPTRPTAAPPTPLAFSTAATLAGPVAAVTLSDADLLAALTAVASRGVELRKDKRWHLPFTDRTEAVQPQAVVDAMNAHQESKLSVRTPNTDVLPLRDRQDVLELSAFFAGGDVRQLGDPSLGSLIRDLHMDGYELKDGAGNKSDAIGPYGAYNALAGPWDGPRAAWVWRNGVSLTALSADAGARPVEVREEIRRSKLALEDLEKKAPGDAEAKRDLDVLRPAVGEATFATRAEILARIREKSHHYGDHRVDYGLVARSVRPGEKLQDVADFFIGIVERNPYGDTRDMHGAFNYSRTKLGNDPVLMRSFLDVYGATKDVNATVRAMDVLRQPVASSLYTDREKAYLDIVKAENDLQSSSYGDGNVAQSALDDFQYVAHDLRPGEPFQDAMADWLSVLQGLNQARKGIGESKATFRHIRDNLGNDPTRKAWFRDAFASTGGLEGAKKAVEAIDSASNGSPKPEVRAEVLLGLLRNTHAVDEAKTYYDEVASSLKPGEDFRDAGTLMFGLMDDLHETDYYGGTRIQPGLRRAYAYARQNLDPAATKLFRDVVKARKSYEDAVDAYPALRPAVRAESEGDRVAQFLRLNALAGRDERPVDWYKTVTSSLLGGETLEQGVSQMEALAKAIRKDRDEADFSKAFVDLKQRHAGNPDEVRLFTRLCDGLESYNSAKQARLHLEKSIRGEDLAARESLLFRLLDMEKDGTRLESVANYDALAKHLVDGESVEDGLTRFIALRTALRGDNAAANARDAFAFVDENMKKGNITGRTANEVTAEMVESLLLNGDINAAKNRALAPRNAAGGSIEKKDEYVIIGGIKVPIQR